LIVQCFYIERKEEKIEKELKKILSPKVAKIWVTDKWNNLRKKDTTSLFIYFREEEEHFIVLEKAISKQLKILEWISKILSLIQQQDRAATKVSKIRLVPENAEESKGGVPKDTKIKVIPEFSGIPPFKYSCYIKGGDYVEETQIDNTKIANNEGEGEVFEIQTRSLRENTEYDIIIIALGSQGFEKHGRDKITIKINPKQTVNITNPQYDSNGQIQIPLNTDIEFKGKINNYAGSGYNYFWFNGDEVIFSKKGNLEIIETNISADDPNLGIGKHYIHLAIGFFENIPPIPSETIVINIVKKIDKDGEGSGGGKEEKNGGEGSEGGNEGTKGEEKKTQAKTPAKKVKFVPGILFERDYSNYISNFMVIHNDSTPTFMQRFVLSRRKNLKRKLKVKYNFKALREFIIDILKAYKILKMPENEERLSQKLKYEDFDYLFGFIKLHWEKTEGLSNPFLKKIEEDIKKK